MACNSVEIDGRPPRPHLALQNCNLMPEGVILCLKLGFGLDENTSILSRERDG
jgi:hypothetical protein